MRVCAACPVSRGWRGVARAQERGGRNGAAAEGRPLSDPVLCGASVKASAKAQAGARRTAMNPIRGRMLRPVEAGKSGEGRRSAQRTPR